MHGYSRLGTGRSNATPSSSPPSSPRFRHGRGKNSGGRATKQRMVERLVFMLVSAVFRRKGVLLFAPLLYISGMLLYMGSLGFDVVSLKNTVGVVVHKRTPPGSVYRSPQVFEKLWPFMEAENNGRANALMMAWNSSVHQGWKPCVNKIISKTELPKSSGFLIIEANGGLNQQRLSICDAVAVAGLLNATLFIPIFHLNSVWRDSSKFGDIFDEDFFINALKSRVDVVKELPEEIRQRFDNNISNIVNLRVKAWSSPTHYLQKVLPKLVQMGAARIAPFSNRLAQAVPANVQSLRCLANYEALRFSEPIRMLAENMVDRMVKNSSQSGGKYVSVHLRFEEDMVAFSCCEYDGGAEEKREMDIARERSWRGKFRRRGRVIRPGANRVDGKCPLTPLEVGMMLRGMGFDNTTSVFVAAGKIYRAEKYMAPLKQMFPRLETKDTLATPEELAPFKGHSSRLAALDYTVCLHSEVFVTTQGGNFPHFLMGHRRYLYGGHAKTIKPDKRKLALLFDSPNISSFRWEDFRMQMQDMLRHSDHKGVEMKKPAGSLYTFPMPDCMCKHAEPRNENSNTTGLV
ncbi:O-fucosyltransferase 9 isoform X1 [Juglans microcarpa x Juglans regia]|uniref:O-fucosyltransferase 9 isoform X1 n=1 Tax=Juglans microcarpa x Juglans regia TaxID=2249226 RepID=UPI001B7DD1F0|nr:O-fucosyltransferase 9 isoform X1 [Juglans microcarpa x Juglans regia]